MGERLYELEPSKNCAAQIRKLTRKNKALADALDGKINQILEHPAHYKPLGDVLAGRRRVHIGHFVLVFEIDEAKKTVVLLKFSHHDEAY